MKEFRITDRISVVCEWKKTRSGFKHEATLLLNGNEMGTAKVCYLNRTWESYEYQTVLHKVIEKHRGMFTPEELRVCQEYVKGNHTDWSQFKSTAMVAAMGEIFGTTDKEKNDWKARMIKAGLPGIQMPDDWDTLDEATKKQRLDAVIKLAQGVEG